MALSSIVWSLHDVFSAIIFLLPLHTTRFHVALPLWRWILEDALDNLIAEARRAEESI